MRPNLRQMLCRGSVALVACLVLAVASPAQEAVPVEGEPDAAQPAGLPLNRPERWLYNSRERTREALEKLQADEAAQAMAAAAMARQLDPTDPAGAFNQGTVGLMTGDAGAAVEPLTAAWESQQPMATDAAYNLGNAHYQQQQLDEAIDWYQETLRRDPGRIDAKVNLELAIKEQQQQKQQQQNQGDEGSDQSDPPPQPEQRQGEEESETEQPQPGEEPSPLPRFQPRPDMTAEEAASLLKAVEAMEREARTEMQPEARRAAPGNRDW